MSDLSSILKWTFTFCMFQYAVDEIIIHIVFTKFKKKEKELLGDLYYDDKIKEYIVLKSKASFLRFIYPSPSSMFIELIPVFGTIYLLYRVIKVSREGVLAKITDIYIMIVLINLKCHASLYDINWFFDFYSNIISHKKSKLDFEIFKRLYALNEQILTYEGEQYKEIQEVSFDNEQSIKILKKYDIIIQKHTNSEIEKLSFEFPELLDVSIV